MLEWLPVEMRAMSVLSAILFFFGGIILLFFHRRVNKIDNRVFDKSLDIEKLSEMCANTEKAVESIKEDNRKMIDWIREDSKTNWSRVEKSLAEIRGRLYGSD
jgi:biopolymer transport protein ExbB/TolQ